MKKFTWIVALLAALTLVFVGCGGGGGDKEEGDIVKTITLGDNFEYGDGYQAVLDGILKQSVNLTGNIAGKIEPGKTYALKMTFTASRDFEQALEVALVDPKQRGAWDDPDVSYWHPLSYKPDDADGNPDPDNPMWKFTGEGNTPIIIKAGTEYTVEVEFSTIFASAADDSNAANTLVIATKGEGVKGNSGSGVKKPVKLECTFFAFVEGTLDDIPDAPTPPPVDDLPAGAVSLGEFDLNAGTGDEAGAESQAVWGSVELAKFSAAKVLVIETTNEIAGGIDIISSYSANDWWKQSSLLNNDGSGITGKTVVSADKKKLTITLATAMDDYNDIVETHKPDTFKLTLAYYTGANKMAGLGITKAYFLNN